VGERGSGDGTKQGDVGGAARCECYHATASSCGIAVSSISLAQKGRISFSSLSFLFQKRSISIVGLLAAQQLPLQLLDSKENAICMCRENCCCIALSSMVLFFLLFSCYLPVDVSNRCGCAVDVQQSR
jgi:hypothetical protein